VAGSHLPRLRGPEANADGGHRRDRDAESAGTSPRLEHRIEREDDIEERSIWTTTGGGG